MRPILAAIQDDEVVHATSCSSSGTGPPITASRCCGARALRPPGTSGRGPSGRAARSAQGRRHGTDVQGSNASTSTTNSIATTVHCGGLGHGFRIPLGAGGRGRAGRSRALPPEHVKNLSGEGVGIDGLREDTRKPRCGQIVVFVVAGEGDDWNGTSTRPHLIQ